MDEGTVVEMPVLLRCPAVLWWMVCWSVAAKLARVRQFVVSSRLWWFRWLIGLVSCCQACPCVAVRYVGLVLCEIG